MSVQPQRQRAGYRVFPQRFQAHHQQPGRDAGNLGGGRSGGFHYKRVDGQWVDTRTGKELFQALSDITTEQGGAPVVVSEN